MYKDELWYRELERAVEQHRDLFTDKQWSRYRIDYLLRVANRVREFSEACETCKAYQHILTRLEEELQELPDSKAQRQYQTEQLWTISAHFVAEHRLAPPRFFLISWLRYGVYAGLAIGFVTMLIVGSLLLLPVTVLAFAGIGAISGWVMDQKFVREQRLI